MTIKDFLYYQERRELRRQRAAVRLKEAEERRELRRQRAAVRLKEAEERRELRRQRAAVRLKEAEERRAGRLQKRSAKAVADPQELEERAKRRAAAALDRLQAAEVAKRDAELAKATEREARAALWDARRQENLIKKMDRDCARAEKEAHVKELVERLGELGAKYALRSEAKMQRRSRFINRRKRTPVELEALSKRRFENHQKTIQRRHARRLGLTLGQYRAYITERLTLQEALKRSKDGFPLAQ